MFETKKAGTISGFINLAYVSGPNIVEVEILINTPVPSMLSQDNGRFDYYRYEKYEIQRVEGEQYSPIFYLDPVYAPYGGKVKIKLSSGLKTPYYFHIHRR